MTDRRSRIIAELEINLEEILTLFRTLPPEALGIRVYGDGARWTARQVLAHFITIEQSMQWMFRNILAGGPGSPRDFDPERFNATQPAKLDGQPFDTLLETFRTVRDETVAIVAAAEEADLDRRGWHAFHGHGTLERFIVWAYEHARLHAEDLQKALDSSRWDPV